MAQAYPPRNLTGRGFDCERSAADILPLAFPGRETLTARECATLAHIVRGASNKVAARMLQISPRTVEFHRANIMRKLGARNLAELMMIVLGSETARRSPPELSPNPMMQEAPRASRGIAHTQPAWEGPQDAEHRG